ncbi:BA75_04993T0 [Komagataella pastoris]|uniref:Ataxin-10 homolog n=1 Tax=Komagataella pastoris TaxID=4922 RepID=A0A1B2JID2_PICPA|nr:BA75_04993T0 [Komagataella pastoris]
MLAPCYANKVPGKFPSSNSLQRVMEPTECFTVLSRIVVAFGNDGEDKILEEYRHNLDLLSACLSLSNSNAGFRREISQSQSTWVMLNQIFSFYLKNSEARVPQDDIWQYKIRTVRGISLLARSMITACTADDAYVQPYVESAHRSISSITRVSLAKLDDASLSNNTRGLYMRLISSSLQFLTNLMNTKLGNEYHGTIDYKLAQELLRRIFFVKESNNATLDLQVVENALYLINSLVDNEEFSFTLMDDQETFVLFLSAMLTSFQELSPNAALEIEANKDQDLNPIELLIISICSKIITKPKFVTWIDTMDPFDGDMPNYLKLFQTLIVNRESWSSEQLIVLITWLTKLFDRLNVDNNSVLTTSLNKLLVSTLDSIASICQYEEIRQYISEYHYFVKFLDLLKMLSIKVPRKALKDSASTIQFPNAKSIIIEILTFLVHRDFKVQEAMRNLQGIEVILNNCNIDENEPFIKERSILCIKYLLENNQANQDFVAKLEAKKVTDDNVLSEAGYEVNIVDGKVKLKPPQPRPNPNE